LLLDEVFRRYAIASIFHPHHTLWKFRNAMSTEKTYDSDSIEALTGLEAVRRRPAMYIGATDDPALPVRLFMQALCHAVDCAIDGRCREIAIRIDGRDAAVAYDAGMPLDRNYDDGETVAVMFLTLHAGCRNLKKHIAVGDELCDLGLVVLNALCETMTVETVHAQRTATYRFAQGRQIEASEIAEIDAEDRTIMQFRLDPEILGDNVVFDHAALRAAIEHLQSRLPGTKVHIEIVA
jgi:DNA gyrase/topoisomerase IV subunit B